MARWRGVCILGVCVALALFAAGGIWRGSSTSSSRDLLQATPAIDLDSLQQQIDELSRQVRLALQKNPPSSEWEQRRAKCGENVERNIDYLHSITHERFWEKASAAVWTDKARQWREFLATTTPSTLDKSSGRGIIMTGGNGDTLQRLVVALRMLRTLGCKLPVEVHHLQGELTSEDMALLRELDAQACNLSDPSNAAPVQKEFGKIKQFHIKSAAMINSKFSEFLALDSDVLPVRDPTYMFEAPEYTRTGTMFWPDFWKTHRNNPIWDIVDAECEDEWEQESGQLLYNKERNFQPLLLANYFNLNSNFYFQLLNGDKDTLRFAHKACKAPYHMVSKFLSPAGLVMEGRFCGHTMVQYDHLGQPIFVHANLIKEFFHEKLNPELPDGVFQTFKEYSISENNSKFGLYDELLKHVAWLKPFMYSSQQSGRPCMELESASGEPAVREVSSIGFTASSLTHMKEPFENLIPGFNLFYKQHGGQGGGI